MKFVGKLMVFYTIALMVSLGACYSMSYAIYAVIDALDLSLIGNEIWFMVTLTVVETLSCSLAVHEIRKLILPIDDGLDDEEPEVFDIKGL